MDILIWDGSKLSSWKHDLSLATIKVGDPLTVEFKRIHIISKEFDFVGKSEVMVVNYVKNKASKDRVIEQITYFDDDASTKSVNMLNKSYSIGPFDGSEYGHPVCFHTPGYEGTVINITTRFWDIDDPSLFQQSMNLLQSGLSIVGATLPAYGVYFTIADEALGVSSRIISSAIKHDELTTPHIIELRIDDEQKPLYNGKYVCLPGLTDLNKRNQILENYFLEENVLLKKDNKGKYIEYNDTYFILDIHNKVRDELMDFDYTASAADILKKLYGDEQDTQSLHQEIVELAKNSYNLGLIKVIQKKYNEYLKSDNNTNLFNELKALYNQIPKDQKGWFDETFDYITKLFD